MCDVDHGHGAVGIEVARERGGGQAGGAVIGAGLGAHGTLVCMHGHGGERHIRRAACTPSCTHAASAAPTDPGALGRRVHAVPPMLAESMHIQLLIAPLRVISAANHIHIDSRRVRTGTGGAGRTGGRDTADAAPP